MANAIEQLMEEHRLIEKVLGSLATFTETLSQGDDDARSRVADFAGFFREFADRCHHGKEEDRLFQAMARNGFPTTTGPVAVMLHEHDVGRAHVSRLAEIGDGTGPLTASEDQSVRTHALEFIPLLANHIQKEDRVLYPMALQSLPAEELAALAEEFEEFERTEMGEGSHDRLHGLADRLIQAFPPDDAALGSNG